jgi:hypothetical protein
VSVAKIDLTASTKTILKIATRIVRRWAISEGILLLELVEIYSRGSVE